MSVDPSDLFRETDRLSEEVTRPFPNSRKVFADGTGNGVRVAMREVTQSDTPSEGGGIANPSLTLYDTSGPYTDPDASVDLAAGLPRLRSRWIEERADSQPLANQSATYAKARSSDPRLAEVRFPNIPLPRCARPGANVTQMH